MLGLSGPELWAVVALLIITMGLVGLGSDDTRLAAIVFLVIGCIALLASLTWLSRIASG